MSVRIRVVTVLAVLAGTAGVTAATAPPAAAVPTSTTLRASVTSAAGQLTAPSLGSAVADNGHVAFATLATGLGTTDGNGGWDVYVRAGAATVLVSRSSTSATTTASGASDQVSISADARWVAFRSAASNLVAGDTNGRTDVFVLDRDPNGDGLDGADTAMHRVGGADGDSDSPSVAAGAGTAYVAFRSDATTLVANDFNATSDVFVRDVTAGTTWRASTDSTGVEGNGPSRHPSVGNDGTALHVAYESDADNLINPDDVNGLTDVFVTTRAIAGGAVGTVLASRSSNKQGDGRSYEPAIAATGAKVAFTTDATNLAGLSDTNGVADVVLRDLSAYTTRISIGTARSDSPSLSADGRWVAFRSFASDIVSGDTNGVRDVFVHDTLDGSEVRVSVTSADLQATGRSYQPAVSGNGQYVSYHSEATDLVGGDTNGVTDVFVRLRDVTPPALPAVTVTSAHNGSTWSKDTTIDVTISSSDTGSGLAGYSVRWEGYTPVTPDTTIDVPPGATTLTSPAQPQGNRYLHIRAVDVAGNWSEVRHVGPLKVDGTAPVPSVTTPDVPYRITVSTSIPVAWTATDAPGSGVKSYDVYAERARYDRTTAGFEAPVLWKSATTATSGTFTGVVGYTYRFSVRARDNAGNVSALTAKRYVMLPADDTSLARSGTWTTSTGSSYYGGEASRSTVTNSFVRLNARDTGHYLAIVMTKCPTCGKFRVYVNGSPVGLETDTYSATTKYQYVYYAPIQHLSVAYIDVKVTSSGKPVIVEGLGVFRY
jgi:hypothetical protein